MIKDKIMIREHEDISSVDKFINYFEKIIKKSRNEVNENFISELRFLIVDAGWQEWCRNQNTLELPNIEYIKLMGWGIRNENTNKYS